MQEEKRTRRSHPFKACYSHGERKRSSGGAETGRRRHPEGNRRAPGGSCGAEEAVFSKKEEKDVRLLGRPGACQGRGNPG